MKPTLIFLLIASSVLGQARVHTESRPDSRPTTKPAAAVPITAKDLLTEYNRNEKRANTLLKGKLIEVSGFVDKIGKDLQGRDYVMVRAERVTNDIGPYYIQCIMKRPPAENNLWVGGKVRIRGVCEGPNLMHIILKDAEVVL